MLRSMGTTIVLLPAGVRIPGDIVALETFRRWTRSDSFPREGRIDWVGGEMEVDLSPERANSHGGPKGEVAHLFTSLVQHAGRGFVYIDSMRYADEGADLSAEPDVLVVLVDSLERGRVRLIRSAKDDDVVEIAGAVDLVVEVVSRGSRDKDTRTLPPRYYRAGVGEYWLVDALGESPMLSVHVRGPDGFVENAPDDSGFRRSPFLGLAVRLVRQQERAGLVAYRVETRP